MDFSWGPGLGSCDPYEKSAYRFSKLKWFITPYSLVYTLLQKKGNFKNVAILLRLSVFTSLGRILSFWKKNIAKIIKIHVAVKINKIIKDTSCGCSWNQLKTCFD